MFFEKEIKFLCNYFSKCQLKTHMLDISIVLDPSEEISEEFNDLLLARDIHFIRNSSPQLEPRIVYKLTDPFLRTFIFFLLPNENKTIFLIGPFFSEQITQKKLLALSEKAAPGPGYKTLIDNYFMSIPYFSKDSHVFIVLETFCELIWGGIDNFNSVDISIDKQGGSFIKLKEVLTDSEKASWNMKLMEERYACENELMHAVAHGQTQKSELLLSAFPTASFVDRSPYPLQNAKNYCIILNTLLRKAAENGGVHPVYLDSQSTELAGRIDKLASTAELSSLMTEMFRSYCRLVRRHSMKRYSPPIQKIISVIDFDLTANLTLSALAETQDISPSYLSSLFKHEVGKTLTEYVNGKRIEKAMQLLKTTKMQIQTVAKNCGISDVHYFSKLFRKTTGMTPKEYRASFITSSNQ